MVWVLLTIFAIIVIFFVSMKTDTGRGIWAELDREFEKFRHHSPHNVPTPKYGSIGNPIKMRMEIEQVAGLPEQALINLHLYDHKQKNYRIVKSSVDTGSSALVIPTDACTNCQGNYGTWDSKAEGKESKAHRDFSYGGGDYDASYWNTICTFDDNQSVSLEFAGVDKVKSGQRDFAGIAGAMPQHSDHPGFMTQLYNNLQKHMPRSFVFDMVKKEFVVGERRTGIQIKFLNAKEFQESSGFFVSEVPYYIVNLKGVSVSVDDGKLEKVKEFPKHLIIDTGTTFLAGSKKMTSSLSKYASKGNRKMRIVVHLEGGASMHATIPLHTGYMKGSMYSTSILEKIDGMLVGIVFMQNRVLTFDNENNTIFLK